MSSGPPSTLRVALSELPERLDPASADGRDAETVIRALFATPLRADPVSGALRAGLCTSWRARRGFREWRIGCSRATAVATQLRRVRHRRLFAPIRRVEARGRTLTVRLAYAWRSFPYLLTTAAAAPRSAPGPFRLVRASRDRIVAARPGLRLVFLRLSPYKAVRAFRRGDVDEAPVPQGELRALLAEPELRGEVRVRQLLGVDLVVFRRLGALRELRRVYWETAPRADYQALVPERAAPTAFGLLPSAKPPGAAEARRARAKIADLPKVPVRIAVPDRPGLREAAEIPWAEWRQLGLPAELVGPGRPAEAAFLRLVAPYPLPEALFAALLSPRALLEPLRLLDQELRDEASVVPLARVIDARLVSPRVRGWGEDALGGVDYARASLEPGP